MKLVIFNYRQNPPQKSKNQSIKIERLLFLSCIIVFVLMVFVQAALTNPSIRTFLTGHSDLEGIPLQTEEYLFSEGQLELKLLSSDANEDLKILVNGDEISDFSQDIVQLSVKNGDVIEVDGSGTDGVNEVEIVSKSDNIVTDCVGEKISIDKNVKQLGKLKVTEK